MRSKLKTVAICVLLLAGCQLRPPPVVQFVSANTVIREGSSLGICVRAMAVDRESVAVRFDWGDGDTSDWSPFFGSADTFVMSHTWSDTGRMFVLAQAKTRAGARSDWRGEVRVTVLDSALVRWVVPLEWGGNGAPTVGPDGTVYIVTSTGYYDKQLLALGSDGVEKWRYVPPDNYSVGLPVVGADGTIFVVCNVLEALSPDGDLRWTDSVSPEGMEAPALGPDGAVYFAHADTAIALNADLTRRWAAVLPGTAYGWPAVGVDGTMLFACYDTWCVVAFGSDGSQRWRTDGVQGKPSAGPQDGFLLTGNSYQAGSALDSTGSVLWAIGSSDQRLEPVVVEDSLVCIRADDALLLLNTLGKTIRGWHEDYTGSETTPVLDADGNVCFGAGGVIVSRRLDSLSSLSWRLEPGEYLGSQFALAPDGMLYVVTGNELLAIRNGAGPAAGTWPQFRHDARHTGCAAGGVR